MEKRKCFAVGCEVQIDREKVFCLDHWRQVPREQQKQIYELNPSEPGNLRKWIALVKEQQRAIFTREKKDTRPNIPKE